jgi:hypothetical protein
MNTGSFICEAPLLRYVHYDLDFPPDIFIVTPWM